MDVASEAQLASMGLRSKRQGVDEVLDFSAWDRKAALHRAIRALNTPDRPAGEDTWRVAVGTTQGYNTKCNAGICIINISAVVPETGPGGAPKDSPVQSYLCKKEMAVWMKKYLTSSDGPTKYNQHLKQASHMDMYSVPQYFT